LEFLSHFFYVNICLCVCVFVCVCLSACVCAGGSSVVCVSLLSLGVQTCSEDQQTSWRTQDCSRSAVETRPDPLGWYQKPGTEYKYTHYKHVQVHTLQACTSAHTTSMYKCTHFKHVQVHTLQACTSTHTTSVYKYTHYQCVQVHGV